MSQPLSRNPISYISVGRHHTTAAPRRPHTQVHNIVLNRIYTVLRSYDLSTRVDRVGCLPWVVKRTADLQEYFTRDPLFIYTAGRSAVTAEARALGSLSLYPIPQAAARQYMYM